MDAELFNINKNQSFIDSFIKEPEERETGFRGSGVLQLKSVAAIIIRLKNLIFIIQFFFIIG